MKLFDSPEIKHIHFIGIGGSSMSGLAEILINRGYRISGSDMKPSGATRKLEQMGALVHLYHSEENIDNPDLVVYTVAVKDENPELVRERELNIPVIDRAALLGQLMKGYPYSLAISGTHGKTTTTSMVTMIIMEAGLDPTVHIGGELNQIGGNTRIGGNNYFITEACEYYQSFLKFHPYLAVILNVELDHVDYLKNLDHIKETFLKFVQLVPPHGYVVACADDSNTMELLNDIHCQKITYGIAAEDAMWSVRDIAFDDIGCAAFTLVHKNEELGQIKLNVPGIHNVSNSLAAIASCYTLGCGVEAIKEGLYKFTGTHRRFEFKGVSNGVKVIDDYAHHPSEVTATLKAAKNTSSSRIWCVFQPHTYTRTKSLLNEFSTAFSDADAVIVADIYAAREPDRGEIHASALADRIVSKGQKAVYINGFDNIVEYLDENVSPGDMVITMGAGDIYKAGEMFLKERSVAANS